MTLCIVGEALNDRPAFSKAYEAGVSATELGRAALWPSATSIKVHRRRDCSCYRGDKPPVDTATLRVEASDAGGEFSGLVTHKPLKPSEYTGAFAKVYELAGLDPADYVIVADTVKFSSWQQSARSSEGDRDVVTLYAYSARFRRLSAFDRASQKRVDQLAAQVAKRRLKPPVQPRESSALGMPVAHTTLWADWQLGKDEGGGVEATVARVLEDLSESVAQVRANDNITDVLLCFMGDPVENVSDSYPSQQFIVQMNLTNQILLALDLMERVISEHLELGVNVHVLSVLCNHGQLTRKNTKTNVTDDSDNVQNLLMHVLRDKVFADDARITWHLPFEDDGMITTATVAGVNVAAAHGHKISGREDAWLLKQTANLTAKRGFTPRVWLTAHRHSFNVLDLGSVSRIQAATNDGGSKHFEDGSGIYSTPGTVALLVGNHDPRGWSSADLL